MDFVGQGLVLKGTASCAEKNNAYEPDNSAHPLSNQNSERPEGSLTLTTHNSENHELIGRGSSSNVYRPYRNSRFYVEKVYHSRQTDAFIREAFILKQLKHPNIIQLVSMQVFPEASILLDYMPQGSLFSHIQTNIEKPLEWQFIHKTLKKVAHGLAYLHDENVLHLDIKSHNILLHEEDVAKICDFEISLIVPQRRSTHLIKNHKGTFYWMAPETLLDGKSCKRSDVYAFGMIIYEMTARKTPWGVIPIPEFIDKIKKLEQPAYSDDSPTFFKNLYYKCVEQAPSKRPSSQRLINKFANPLEEQLPQCLQTPHK